MAGELDSVDEAIRLTDVDWRGPVDARRGSRDSVDDDVDASTERRKTTDERRRISEGVASDLNTDFPSSHLRVIKAKSAGDLDQLASHAHPGGWLHVLFAGMHASPHAFPVAQTRQHVLLGLVVGV